MATRPQGKIGLPSELSSGLQSERDYMYMNGFKLLLYDHLLIVYYLLSENEDSMNRHNVDDFDNSLLADSKHVQVDSCPFQHLA